MDPIDKIAESKIIAALERGELDDLPGQGQPLELDDDSAIPPELRVAHRILKNSGHLPATVHLNAEIKRIEDQLKRSEGAGEKAGLVAKLGLLKTRLAGESRGLRKQN